MTPDHQPQAAILEHAMTLGIFKVSSPMEKRAKNRAKNGYAINIHDIRHRAGRTFGGKGTKTKNNFAKDVENQTKNLTEDQEKRNKVVNLIKRDLKWDVKEMKEVAQDKNKYYSDVNKLEIEVKDNLKEKIKNQILRGEEKIKNQPLDELKSAT